MTEGDAFQTDTPQTVDLVHSSNHLHLFLYLLYSARIIYALFLYQTGNVTAQTSPSLTFMHALNGTSQVQTLDFHCTEEGSSIRYIPQGSDCRRITDHLMPFSPHQHPFHRRVVHGDREIYQLRNQIQFRTCAIDVDLVPGFISETTSWLTIRATAIGIIQKCLHTGSGVGGWVELGDHHGISITLLGSLRGTVEGNKTTS